MSEFIKKHYPVIAIAVIVVSAFYVRYTHFNEWLFFKWDQGRDAIVAAKALNKGPGELPLLGPRAAKVSKQGDYLRLGPAYYYMQYTSGLVFNSTEPQVFAYPDLLFSIAVLPLLYLLYRIIFSKPISLLLVFLYAFSFIVIQYSRFSWNPNPVPFFAVLAILSLLRFSNAKEGSKAKYWWIASWAFATAVASQLHFFAFFALSGISGLYFAVKYEWWNLKKIFSKPGLVETKYASRYMLVAAAIILLIYTPVIISDMKRGGENTKNFITAFTYKPADKPLRDKFNRNIIEQGKNFFLILSGKEYPNSNLTGNRLSMWGGLLFLLSGVILTIRELRRAGNQIEKDFFKLLLIWLGVFALVSIPMAFQLRSRFYVSVFALAFIFVGLWFRLIKDLLGKSGYALIGLISLVMLWVNMSEVHAWFEEQRLAQLTEPVEASHTLILKRQDGVTLAQMQKAVRYIFAQTRTNKDKQLVYAVRAEYIPGYLYLFQLENPQMPVTRFRPAKPQTNQNIYFISSVGSELKGVDERVKDKIQVIGQEQFGQVLVYTLRVPDGAGEIKLDEKKEASENESETPQEEEVDEDRTYWKDVL